jgi:L-seryl-tRNA(Ser) seleniumtransferase
MGADFQCIAAKYLGASQSTGLALGTKEMIEKISFQSFVGYESRRIRGIGRPHKVDRQEMIGVVAAIKHWFTIDHEDRLAHVEQQCQNIASPLNEIPGLQVEMIDNIIGHQPFGIVLRVDPKRSKLSAQRLVDTLKAGDPPIWTRVGPSQDTITIHGFGLQDGEDKIVGERIYQALTN